MPTFGPNGQDVFERTYARVKEDGSLESWEDTVRRVVRGNLALVPEEHWLPGEEDKLFNLIYEMKAIPAGRHLWVTGVEGRQFNRNCHRAGWGPRLSDHFTFTFSELMKGGGVGANYSSSYLQTLPAVRSKPEIHFVCSPSHKDYESFSELLGVEMEGQYLRVPSMGWYFRVSDTREGWVEALGLVIDSFVSGPQRIFIDVSDVRPSGEPLRTFGGIASGPGPLLTALKDVHEILSSLDTGRRLNPLQAMAIDHALAACVVAGNVRRSARMSILHWRDPYIFDFIACKTGEMAQWSTNISVEIDNDFFQELEFDDSHASKVFRAVTEGMLLNGEPGFYNSALASVGEKGDVRATNPCGEIALEPWESCNLGHINLAAFPPGHDGLWNAFRLMTRFLIRATFAELTDPRQAEIEAVNRRIGVGFFGFQEFCAAREVKYSEAGRNEKIATDLGIYRSVVDIEAYLYAKQLGIPIPVKTTCIAPTGTIAKLPGVSEGIHPIYARFFERRIRYSANDPRLEELAARGLTIEDCLYSANTKVVVFHVADPITKSYSSELIEQADEISLADLLEVQSMVQRVWANNAVSFTANVPETLTLQELQETLRAVLPTLKGTTIMVDASRPQSPYTRLSEAEYLAATDHEIGQAELDCSTGACPVR